MVPPPSAAADEDDTVVALAVAVVAEEELVAAVVAVDDVTVVVDGVVVVATIAAVSSNAGPVSQGQMDSSTSREGKEERARLKCETYMYAIKNVKNPWYEYSKCQNYRYYY